jgi:hypothetical protein
MALVLTSDFTGEYHISETCYTELETYITKYEKYYLLMLLGADLYDLFISDLDASTPQVPQTAIYLSIFNEFYIDDNSCLYVSDGIKVMLIQFIYWKYNRDNAFSNTTVGFKRTIGENSDNLGYNGDKMIEVYNDGTTNHNAIEWYICDNDTDYPLYNGVHLGFTSGI